MEFAFNGGLPSGAARVAFGTRREKQRSGVRVCSHIGKPFKAANAEERHCSVAVPSSGLRSAARCSTCCSAPASFFRWERTARGIGVRENVGIEALRRSGADLWSHGPESGCGASSHV